MLFFYKDTSNKENFQEFKVSSDFEYENVPFFLIKSENIDWPEPFKDNSFYTIKLNDIGNELTYTKVRG